MEGAFAVLKEAALGGNAMACFDAGYMMIQGIGCVKDLEKGMGLLKKGYELAKDSKNARWKEEESVCKLFEPQPMFLRGLF